MFTHTHTVLSTQHGIVTSEAAQLEGACCGMFLCTASYLMLRVQSTCWMISRHTCGFRHSVGAVCWLCFLHLHLHLNLRIHSSPTSKGQTCLLKPNGQAHSTSTCFASKQATLYQVVQRYHLYLYQILQCYHLYLCQVVHLLVTCHHFKCICVRSFTVTNCICVGLFTVTICSCIRLFNVTICICISLFNVTNCIYTRSFNVINCICIRLFNVTICIYIRFYNVTICICVRLLTVTTLPFVSVSGCSPSPL